jgi:hypothetical protein
MTTRTDEVLAGCEGFDVISPDGRLGFVDRLLFVDPDADPAPAVLVVQVGLFGRHALLVDSADVGEVDFARRRLTLGAAPTAAGSEAVVHLGHEQTSGEPRHRP